MLDGKVPSSAFTGKIVLVGVTAPIGKDVFTTSASSKPMSGVEVQANSIETALLGFPLRSLGLILSLALIIALAVAPVPLSLRLSSLLVGLCSIAIAILFLGSVEIAFRHGLLLPVPDPIVGLLTATGGVIAVESLLEQRKRLALETLLQDFLRPTERAFFVSYRRDQGSFVARSLRSALAARFGDASVFMDVTAMSPARSGHGKYKRPYSAAEPCWSSSAPTGSQRETPDRAHGGWTIPEDWVRREVEAGLGRPEVAVIPVLVDGAAMPKSSDLPLSLRPLSDRTAFVLTGVSFDQEVDALVDGIRRGQLSPLRHAGALHSTADTQNLPSVRRRSTGRAGI